MGTSNGLHFSPLICALDEKRWPLAHALISHPRVDINLSEPAPIDGAADLLGRSPLAMAIQADHLDTIERLLAHPDIDLAQGCWMNGHRVSCLYFAVVYYKAAVVEAMVRSEGIAISADVVTEAMAMLNTNNSHLPMAQQKVRNQAALRIANAILTAPAFPADNPNAGKLRHMVEQAMAAQATTSKPSKKTGGGKPMLNQLLAGSGI
eukprot:NODE_1048_length_1082_cov_278.484995_g428_i1.p1 GENE.NODE_1048_length_1082_cov_278.484995_g428_i1~~NODE_1048_length_1082_cov_278.484995_g428_i1.p1  ORF type:complete len:215 (+),score=102.06 NODE_1048_length_1082_cov_278.484995_g428_i1:25-645(+)